MSRFPCLLLAFVAIGSLQTQALAAVSIYTDVGFESMWTLVLKNFNTSAQEHTGLSANNPTPFPVWAGNTNGYGRYDTKTGTDDPKVNFNSTVRFDVNVYNYVRVRQRASVTGQQSEIWPNGAVGPTTVNLGTVSTTFTESNRMWADPTNPAIITATSGGVRWDPIVRPNPATADASFDLDYIVVDRGRVRGFEFDVSEGISADLQGWNFSQVTGQGVSNGAASGTTTGIDAYLTQNALDLDTSIYKSVEIRMRASAGSTQQIYWDDTASYNELQRINLALADGEWHRYVIDFSAESTWTDARLNGFRIDVANGAVGNFFEIDYIRFREVLAAPEPTRALLVVLGVCFGLTRRSRRLRA